MYNRVLRKFIAAGSDPGVFKKLLFAAEKLGERA
jgi:hypothetical protein